MERTIGHAPNDIFIGPKYVANHGTPSLRWELQWGQSMVRKPLVGIHHLRAEAQLIYYASKLFYVFHRYLQMIVATSISCLFWNSFSQVSPHSLCRTNQKGSSLNWWNYLCLLVPLNAKPLEKSEIV